PEPARADGPPLESHRLSAMASRALGVTPGTSLLVRPDGMPAGILGAMPVGLAPVRGKEATPA
ncbi:MAG: hypothetical protein M3Y34_03250, partial [Actinomycetota bacterium]|nr:hypothetical protein [Actinomycetota bacterium]